jgi:hypothetical protein
LQFDDMAQLTTAARRRIVFGAPGSIRVWRRRL